MCNTGFTMKTKDGTIVTDTTHDSKELDEERTHIYHSTEMDGAIQYGHPGKLPPKWLQSVMNNEMRFFNGIMHGDPVPEEFKALMTGEAARAAIATADAATISRFEDRYSRPGKGRLVAQDGVMKKYQGIYPAFYACYDEEGKIDVKAVRALAELLVAKGVQGLYVGGSSGECIYQSVEERKAVLEAVMEVARGKVRVIAHVACNNTADSMVLAAHAEQCAVDAIASIPPIYFHLPPDSIAAYWNDISSAAPNTDFIIYNIPQLAGVALTIPLFRKMLENPRVRTPDRCRWWHRWYLWCDAGASDRRR